MIPRYAGIGQTCPLFNLQILPGGQLSATTKYFSFQLQNRCGFNLPTVSDALDIPANSKLRITIPQSVRKPAWDIHYFVVSCGTSADASTHVQIARVPGYQFGAGISPQSVPQDLPYTFELTCDEHVALAPSVPMIADLPTGSDSQSDTSGNRLDGQVRFVTDYGFWLEYRADSNLPTTNPDVTQADIGQWVRIGGASTYVSSTETGVGCDRSLTTINPITTIPTPQYPALNRVLPDWEAKYWLVNDDTYSLSAGTEFGVELEYNSKRSPDLLAGLFMVKFLGFADTVTGEYRTEDLQGRDFPSVGGYFAWNPRKEAPFVTADDLQPNEAIALAVKPYFTVADLNNQVSPKSIIGVVPVIRTQSGDYNPLGKLLPGGAVFAIEDKYRVVPDFGLGAFILPGTAIIASYDFPVKPKRNIYGFQPNLAGQKVVINGNGAVFVEMPSYQTLASEAIRAIISTVPGSTAPGEWSTKNAIASGQGVKITVNYPCNTSGNGAIRNDYPDVVKGNSKGSFNPVRVKLYLQQASTSEIREFTGYAVIAAPIQEFFLSTWNDGTLVTSLPIQPETNFSLFAPGGASIASSISGNFPAAEYRCCYSFEYDGNQITSISHASPPCIKEWVGDFQPVGITIDGVDTLAPGSNATVNNLSVASNVARLRFGIPSGSKGDEGDKGLKWRGAYSSNPEPEYISGDLVKDDNGDIYIKI